MVVSVLWDFGDGQTSQAFNPRHTYSQPGRYAVRLTVTDNSGLTDTQVMPFTVLESVGTGLDPTAVIRADVTRGLVPLAVTLDGRDSRAAGSAEIVSYKWDFPDQTTAYGPVVHKTFTEAYSQPVYLRVTDSQGLAHETQINIEGVMTAPRGIAGAPLQTQGNPFTDSAFYVSPDIEVLQNQSLEKIDPNSDAKLYEDMKFVQQMPSAVWLDRTIAIYGGALNGGRRPLSKMYLNAEDPYQGLGHFDEAVRQQQALADESGKIPPMTAVIIVYNLPDRDCAALASNGLLNETNDANGDGKPDGTGMQEYQQKYIDVIAEIFAKYPTLRIVAMLEPDGYPNMITNVGKMFPKCDNVSAAKVYEKALQYAINKLSALNNVYIYMDIGHSGWLGWPDNLSGAIRGFTGLVQAASPKGLRAIKGFASNTSGYTPLREPFISNAFEDRQALAGFYEWNQHVDELSFIDALYTEFTKAGFPNDLGFIIDTARNGWGGPKRPTGVGAPAARNSAAYRIDLRKHRGHWCNVADAGIGEIPQADPDPTRPYLDAYFWMKPPGESDGISTKTNGPNEEGKSYDPMCGGEASNSTKIAANVLPNAPHAGAWFHDQFVMLVKNAHPALGTRSAPPGAGGVKPAMVAGFDDQAAGAKPAAPWVVTTTTTTSALVSSDRFAGLQGKSLRLSAPLEPKEKDEVASLALDGGKLGDAAGDFYGRARLWVEETGSDQGLSWTLVNAQGKVDQVGDVKYRLSLVEGKLALQVDSNQRGATCEKVSATALPKKTWACVEWRLNPKGQLAVWLDGESVSDLNVTPMAAGCSNQNWSAGPSRFEQVSFGVSRFRPTGQQPQLPQGVPPPPPKPAVTLFADDLVLSSARAGCGNVRP